MAGASTVPVREGLFRVGADGTPRLLAGRCACCTRLHFPRSGVCPYCGEADVGEAALAGPGTIWASTAVATAPPGYRGEVPYGFGVVELAEGLRVITRFTEADPARLEPGEPVRLEVVPLYVDDDGRTVVTYAFAPEAS